MATRKNTGEEAFAEWMRKVDIAISNRLGGMTSADLTDVCYREWFEDGDTPVAAAKRAIRNESGED